MHEYKILDLTDPKDFCKSLAAHVKEGWTPLFQPQIYLKDGRGLNLGGKEVHYTMLISKFIQLPQK